MNDIIRNNAIGDKLIVDSSSPLAHEEIIDGFSFLTFEFESELRKEYDKKRIEFIKADSSSASSNSSGKSHKKSRTNPSGRPKKLSRPRDLNAASSTASNSSFNDDQASVAESAAAVEPEPKSSPPPIDQPLPAETDEQPSKKPKLDETKPEAKTTAAPSSYDMNTLLAAAASAAATAAVVAATGSTSSKPTQAPPPPPPPSQLKLPPGLDHAAFNPFLMNLSNNSQAHPDPASFINKIMEMCKQQIPNLNIPGILTKTTANANANNINTNITNNSNINTNMTNNSNELDQLSNKTNRSTPTNWQRSTSPPVLNQQASKSVNTNHLYSTNYYMPYAHKTTTGGHSSSGVGGHSSSGGVSGNGFNGSSGGEATDYLRRDLDAKFMHTPMSMMGASPASSMPKEPFMFNHVTKHKPIQMPKPVIKSTGLVQYYPRTNGKWCAAHAKIANMIQDHKSKNSVKQMTATTSSQQPVPPSLHNFNSSQSHQQQMFDAFNKKLHTPTFFPPVQHNLKAQAPPQSQQVQTKGKTSSNSMRANNAQPQSNYLATEAAITAAANHQLMMDKYRHELMRMAGPPMMPPMAGLPPPGMPMMPPPPPGIHMPMSPYMSKSKKSMHSSVPLPPAPQPPPPPLPPPVQSSAHNSHMPPYAHNHPLVQHSFLQQFFMDKNFDPTRFPMPPLPPGLPPGCLMPNMIKPDDKPIT